MTGYTDKHEYTNKNGVKSVVYLMDCMKAMEQMGDKEFALLVADPPYGIGFSDYERGGMGQKVKERHTKNGKKKWDESVPQDSYFINAIRVSVNQIIWGGNYFMPLAKVETPNLKTIDQFRDYMNRSTEKWIFWYKQNPVPNFADGELAWVSFGKSIQFDHRYYGSIDGNTSCEQKIHSTQKPTALYDWIFNNYAKPNDTILDTHLGSGSSRIAADRANLPFTGVELDPDYFRDHCKRFDRYTSQLTIF